MISLVDGFTKFFVAVKMRYLNRMWLYKNFDSNLVEMGHFELERQSVGSKTHENLYSWNASQLKIGTFRCSI